MTIIHIISMDTYDDVSDDTIEIKKASSVIPLGGCHHKHL